MTLDPSSYLHGSVNLHLHARSFKGKDVSFQLHYWGCEMNYSPTPLHQHSYYEIIYTVDGEGTYLEADSKLPLQKNTLVLSRPYMKHQILNADSLFLIYVGFELIANESSITAIEQFRRLETTSNYYISDASFGPTIRIWEALLQIAEQTQTFYHDSIVALTGALMTSFGNLFSEQEMIPRKIQSRKVNAGADFIMNQAKLFIRDNLASPDFTLVDLAGILHISERHLSRIFKEELGQTCAAYIRKERIRQASILLTTTTKTIKQISEETGFDTVHYFTTVFTKLMGISPGKFIDKYAR